MNIAIIGTGRWARALAGVLERQRTQNRRITEVWRVRPRAQGAQEEVETSDLSVVACADVLVLAVPAPAVRHLLAEVGGSLHGGQVLLHAVGRLEPGEGRRRRISEVVLEETPIRRVGALAGPALAQDLEEERPAALICGSRFDDVGEAAVEVLSARALRIYTTRDIVGVELARALVAAFAMAGGLARAMDLGPAAQAILLARGVAEMARLGVALGGSERTFFGLAGLGELAVAIEGRGSADFELGLLLGRGVPLAEAERQIGRTLDGPTMIREAVALGKQHGVRTTLLTAMHRWLAGERSLKEALGDLYAGGDHVE